MAGRGLLGVGIDAAMVFFYVGRVGYDDVLGTGYIRRCHLCDVFMVHGDLVLSMVFYDIFPGNVGKLLLYFNGGDAKRGGFQTQNQGNDAASAANVHDFVPGAGMNLSTERKGVHGKSISLFGLADA